MAKLKRKTKSCVGCCDPFTTYRNYDYCPDCAVNGNRYVSKSNCPECDGSGMIKFRGQKPRPCKTCYLTKPMTKKLTAEEQEEKFWDEVDQLAQEKIYKLFTKSVPFQNIPLITESYNHEDKQQKLTGLFLHRDVDYRTLLSDTENQYAEQRLPNKESLAEEISLWYCRMVVKALISDLKDYAVYENHYFENLTSEE